MRLPFVKDDVVVGMSKSIEITSPGVAEDRGEAVELPEAMEPFIRCTLPKCVLFLLQRQDDHETGNPDPWTAAGDHIKLFHPGVDLEMVLAT